MNASGRMLALEFRGVDGKPRRIVFEPDGDGGHMYIDYRKFAGEWTPVGREPVEDLDVTTEPGATTSQTGF
ncbi:hypothetical protein GCM10009646_79110 [Streptomyces aureus]